MTENYAKFFNTCLHSAEDYSQMMTDLTLGGRYALYRSHRSEASYDLVGLVQILKTFLDDFNNVNLNCFEEKLNNMKDPETLVFSDFIDIDSNNCKFKFLAIDIKPKFERSWFGLGSIQRIYFKTYLVNMEVAIKSKKQFLKVVDNYVNFEIEDNISEN